jgi:hypothetical protein
LIETPPALFSCSWALAPTRSADEGSYQQGAGGSRYYTPTDGLIPVHFNTSGAGDDSVDRLDTILTMNTRRFKRLLSQCCLTWHHTSILRRCPADPRFKALHFKASAEQIEVESTTQPDSASKPALIGFEDCFMCLGLAYDGQVSSNLLVHFSAAPSETGCAPQTGFMDAAHAPGFHHAATHAAGV